MKKHLSRRALATKRSAIRELLKLTARPEIISFAGGLPDPETFPHDEFAEIATDLLRNDYKNVLQYSLSEGSKHLREAIIDWQRAYGFDLNIDQVLVTTASQQGLDLLAKTFIDPGDVIFCGLPTYLGAIQVFDVFQADRVGIPLENDGMNLDILQAEIDIARERDKTMKAVYVVPDFQNPTGITMSLDKRKKLLEIARKEDLLVFEDDPYGQLRFAGDPISSISCLDTDGRVIRLFTMSKVLAAGLRLAVMTGEEELLERVVRMKQASDLCTSKLIQRIVSTYLERYDMEEHLEELRKSYRIKRDAMVDALAKYMPKDDEISWTCPDGGLFLWLTLPEIVDTDDMFSRALESEVAYVPGRSFYVDGSGQNTMRLAFSVASEQEIDEGIKRLASVVRNELERLSVTDAA